MKRDTYISEFLGCSMANKNCKGTKKYQEQYKRPITKSYNFPLNVNLCLLEGPLDDNLASKVTVT